MVKPITPSEVGKNKVNVIPEEVIECWNELITQKYKNGYAIILQKDALTALAIKTGLSRKEVFEKDYLDIADLYRKHGWEVNYDKPAYNESYEASFEFRKKKQ